MEPNTVHASKQQNNNKKQLNKQIQKKKKIEITAMKCNQENFW